MNRLLAAVLLLLSAFLVPHALRADVSPYYNSSEAGCDGNDAAVLFCDDFEDTGWWSTADDPGAAANDGWCGHSLSQIPGGTPAGKVVCGGVGANGTDCAATHGNFTTRTPNTLIQAMHDLASAANEIYFRWYMWLGDGYDISEAEKVLELNQVTLTCAVQIDFLNFNITGPGTSLIPRYARINPSFNFAQNQGNDIAYSGAVGGRWYYNELHVKISSPAGTANGRIRHWANDCGSTGACTGSPILRTDHNNIVIDSGCENNCAADRTKITQWIQSAWSQPAGGGTLGERRTDQIKVATTGPIGFMGAAASTSTQRYRLRIRR